jgi:hypothetical protein
MRAEVPVASDVRRPGAKLNVMLPGSALANINAAELAKSAASRIFCARLTAARRPALDRTQAAKINDPETQASVLVPNENFHLRTSGAAFGAVSLGAAGEIANVSHAFQPSARCSAAKSLYPLMLM